MRESLRSVLASAFMLAALTSLATEQAAAAPTVATLAGSGTWGSTNGNAQGASFMMPAGVAFDRGGNLFITDPQAQRIRELSPTGIVRTIAGLAPEPPHGLSVRGAYVDGPASVARFNHPLGIAVAGNGDLYVADTFNHCIRRIAHDGTVTTYAGTDESSYVDGPRLQARFRQPEGLALDRSGDLYVADVATGLRRISRSGNVTTIDRKTAGNNEAVAVAVYDTDGGPNIFVAERFGLAVLRADGSIERFPGSADFDAVFPAVPKDMLRIIQARRPIGFPTAVAAIDDHTVAFTDARTNSVRLLETVHGTLRIVGGAPNDDASGDTGGFRDGAAGNSLFDAPLGIAVRGRGGLVVADAGNRRIRTIEGIDYRHAVAPALGLLDVGFSSAQHEYRIAYVGNSSVWYNTDWSDSIEGCLERTLNGDHVLPQGVRVIGVAGNEKFGVAAQYAEWLAKIGSVNLVVLSLNTGNLLSSFGDAQGKLPPASTWRPQLTARLRDLRQQLARAGVRLVVVTHPFPNEYDASESAYTQITQDFSTWDDTVGAALNEAVGSSGAALIDLWPKFYEYERLPTHAALFGGDDFHFSKNGRLMVGQWVTQALEGLAPWRTTR